MSRHFRAASTAWKRFTKDVESTPWKRKTAIGAFITLYTVSGIAGYRYLQDTRYRATGEANPYKKTESESKLVSKIVPAHDTTPVYDDLAREYDNKIWMEEVTSYIWWMRRRLGKHVRGDALEVSCGTGRNIMWLKKPQISSLTFVDSSRPMLEVAEEKYEKKNLESIPAQFVQGKAETLADMASKSGQRFDTVYESFGLCSHENPDQALQNMAKLLKPGGHIVLLEHGKGYYETMNQRMDERAEQRSKEWGCRWNLDIPAIVKNSGLTIDEEARYHFGTIQFYVLSRPAAPPEQSGS